MGCAADFLAEHEGHVICLDATLEGLLRNRVNEGSKTLMQAFRLGFCRGMPEA
jgi:hypothetical protein